MKVDLTAIRHADESVDLANEQLGDAADGDEAVSLGRSLPAVRVFARHLSSRAVKVLGHGALLDRASAAESLTIVSTLRWVGVQAGRNQRASGMSCARGRASERSRRRRSSLWTVRHGRWR